MASTPQGMDSPVLTLTENYGENMSSDTFNDASIDKHSFKCLVDQFLDGDSYWLPNLQGGWE